jgi:hypothetical protein
MHKDLRTIFLNPGVLHRIPLPRADRSLQSTAMLFHPHALALRQAGFDRLAKCVDLDQFQSLWPESKQVSGPLPDSVSTFEMEQEYLRATDQHVLTSTNSHDQVFRERFALILSQAAPQKGPILVTQSAPVALTRPLVALISAIGYQPHVLTHKRFAVFFKGLAPNEQIWTFDHCNTISFDALADLRQRIASTLSFRGAVMPCAITRSRLEPRDGYQNVERTALDLTGRIICRVNLKRQFVRGASHASET